MKFEKVLEKMREVGRYQLEKYETEHIIETKTTEFDLVTEVDKESERRLVEFLQKEYPDYSVIAEEGTEHDRSSEYRWVIDPLDGTVNYSHGFPIFCISIALEKNGEPIFGAIYAPKLNEMYFAEKGTGAFLDGERISVSDCRTLGKGLLSTGFAYNRGGKYNNLPYFNHLMMIAGGIRRPGSAAFDLACVASGRLDGFWEFSLRRWDVSAGILMVKEAGGEIIDLSSDEAGSAVIAGNAIMTELIFENLKEAGYEE